MRAQAERIASAEAEHKKKADAFVARRENVLRTVSTKYTGQVPFPPADSQHRVLVIHGLNMTDNQWYLAHLFGKDSSDSAVQQGKVEADRAKACWHGMSVEELSFGYAEDVEMVRACQNAIVSGTYHAVVICDLCLRDLMEEDPTRLFDALIGSHLQAFAWAGGRVAFPTSDGMLMANMGLLNRLFEVSWEFCAYTAEHWGPLLPSSGAAFEAPTTIDVVYSKASSLKNVPPHERVCGVVANGSSYEISPDGDFENDAQFATFAESCGYSAAAHMYGRGCIGYFGDTNCSSQTPPNVAAFCRSGVAVREDRTFVLQTGYVRVAPSRSRLYFDGACRPNPGRGGAGGVLFHKKEGKQEEHPISIPLGECTSNIAEYLGLIWTLRVAKSKGARDPEVHGDSSLIIRQMTGENAVRDSKLELLHTVAEGLRREFDSLSFHEEPRDRNQRADALAGEAVCTAAAFPPGSFLHYYPNLCGYSMVDSPTGSFASFSKILATNDIGTARSNGFSLIDAAFLFSLSPTALQTVQPVAQKLSNGTVRYVSVLTTAAGPLNILGMLKEPLQMTVDFIPYLPQVEGQRADQMRTINAKFIVVLDLPVPLHVSTKGLANLPMFLSGKHALQSNLHLLPNLYQNHSFHKTLDD